MKFRMLFMQIKIRTRLCILGIVLITCQICGHQNVTVSRNYSANVTETSNELIQCPENMIRVPLRNINETTEICDCDSGYLYYYLLDRCFLPYRQGPCELNQYLVLEEGKGNASCVRNPCETDGYVPYEDSCYKLDPLNIGAPCHENEHLVVNSGTFQLTCESIDILFRALIRAIKRCPVGSRRNARGLCKVVFSS